MRRLARLTRWRLVAAATIVPVLGGCAITRSLPDLTQARGPCTDQDGGWCPFTRELSVSAWQYAQLSSNAYCDHTEPFELPAGYTVVSRLPAQDVCDLERAAAKGDKTANAKLKPIHKAEAKLKTRGFNYTIYDKRSAGGALERRVIAFRGTDNSQLADWFYGNIGSTQRDQGLTLYISERAKLDESGSAGVPITVTGHSLGGAIAIQVSLAHAGVDAYVFNTSPLYQLVQPNANRRLAIAERGDLLEALRSRSMPVRQDLLIINCRPLGNNVTDHSVRKLAECITWIAAGADAGAKAAVSANQIAQPQGEADNLLWGLPPRPAL